MSIDLALVERSYALVEPRSSELATRFYLHLFRSAPDTRALFAHTDMERQKRVLLATLAVLVKSLHNLEAVLPAVRFLGKRHADYGVRPEHYAAVGAALVRAMAETAGTDWKPDYTVAWVELYGAVKDAMLGGANNSFAGPVATLERAYGQVTSESKDLVALEIHGRSRSIAHRAAEQTAQTATLRAQFRASMEEIARKEGVPETLWRSPGAGAPAKGEPPPSADDLMAQMEALYTRYLHNGAETYPINGTARVR